MFLVRHVSWSFVVVNGKNRPYPPYDPEPRGLCNKRICSCSCVAQAVCCKPSSFLYLKHDTTKCHIAVRDWSRQDPVAACHPGEAAGNITSFRILSFGNSYFTRSNRSFTSYWRWKRQLVWLSVKNDLNGTRCHLFTLNILPPSTEPFHADLKLLDKFKSRLYENFSVKKIIFRFVVSHMLEVLVFSIYATCKPELAFNKDHESQNSGSGLFVCTFKAECGNSNHFMSAHLFCVCSSLDLYTPSWCRRPPKRRRNALDFDFLALLGCQFLRRGLKVLKTWSAFLGPFCSKPCCCVLTRITSWVTLVSSLVSLRKVTALTSVLTFFSTIISTLFSPLVLILDKDQSKTSSCHQKEFYWTMIRLAWKKNNVQCRLQEYNDAMRLFMALSMYAHLLGFKWTPVPQDCVA